MQTVAMEPPGSIWVPVRAGSAVSSPTPAMQIAKPARSRTPAVERDVGSAKPGMVVGRTNLPAVSRGDALFSIALVKRPVIAGAITNQREENALTYLQ